jgi:antitoxin HicB
LNVQDYLRRPYHIELIRDETTNGVIGWVASVRELPGCLTQGQTPEEASRRIYEVMESWIEFQLEHGNPIPDPLG